MKKIILILLFLSSKELFAQTIPGLQIDSCHKAYNLIPGISSTSFVDFNFYNTSLLKKVFLPLCQDSARDLRVWFKFQTENTPRLYRIGARRMEAKIDLLIGNCNSLISKLCFTSPDLASNYSPFIYLVPNTQYFIKVYKDFTFNNPPGILVQSIPLSRKIRSTAAGGLWHLTTTWQEGRVPIDGDSVFITDGSTVTVNSQSSLVRPNYLDYLQVGGVSNTMIARLNFNTGWLLRLKGNGFIGSGDSLKIARFGSISLYCEKNLILDGIFSNLRTASTIRFNGSGKQVFSGSGKISGQLSYFIVDKPADTLISTFSIHSETLRLYKGVFNNVGPFLLTNQQSFGVDSIRGDIYRSVGKVLNPISFSPPPLGQRKEFVFLKYDNGFYSDFPASDSSIAMANEFQNLPDPFDMFIFKSKGTRIIYNGNLHILKNPFNTFGSLRLRAQDTLHFHLSRVNSVPNDSIPRLETAGAVLSDSLVGLEAGTIMVDSAFVVSSSIGSGFDWLMAEAIFGKEGKQRAMKLWGRWPSDNRKAKGFKMYFNHILQAPTGPMVAPLTFVGGHSIMKISANQPLPTPNRLAFWFFANDFILGNRRDIRLAQAPTPNGPWIVISQAPVSSVTLNLPAGIYSNPNIDLANGEYFCLASVANLKDAQVVNLIAPPSWQVGCGNPLKIGAVIRNLGILPITSATMVATNLNTAQPAFDIYTFPTPLQPLKTDTIWIENGPAINTFGITNLKVKVLLQGDINRSNDSIVTAVDYTLKPMPYTENFNNPALYYIGDSVTANIRLEKGWWINTEFVSGNTYQSWESKLGYLSTWRETSLSAPLLARSPAINIPAGVYLFRYAYRWNQGGPQPTDTLTLSLGTGCGNSFLPIDVVNRNVHPFPSVSGWISRSAIFEKTNDSPAFVELKLEKPFGQSILFIDIDSIRIVPFTSVGQQVATKKLSVFPNPTDGSFSILAPEAGGKITISDMLGRTLLLKDTPESPINLFSTTSWPKGIYLIRWIKNEKLVQQKLVVK